jgi:hypothetical protein
MTNRLLIENIGLDAYQLAVRGGFVGSKTAWLAGLATLVETIDGLADATLAQINIDIPKIRDDIQEAGQIAATAQQSALNAAIISSNQAVISTEQAVIATTQAEISTAAAIAAELSASRVDLGDLDAAVLTSTTQAEISTAAAIAAELSASRVDLGDLDAAVLSATTQANIAIANATSAAQAAGQTTADTIQTGLDRIQTGLDRIQTGLDRSATNLDVVQTGLDLATTTNNAIISTAQQELSTNSANQANASAVLSTSQLALANDARIGAEVARDAAQLSSGVFPDTVTGLLATLEGGYFSVPSENNKEYLILYRHVLVLGLPTAILIRRYPSVAGIEYAVANVLHIKQNGNDSLDGYSWKNALRTIERALELATASNTPTLIEWAPESIVYTNGHLDMPDNCVIKATHRTVFLRPNPGFEERNVFRMGSGCFLEGIMFEGWRLDSLTNPTEGFAVSFRPGAIILRTPYAHKIAVRTIPVWGVIAPPLDRVNQNPEVPRGGGVVLADGLVCSQYSIFPNIMTWGATPVTPNGIGYCAKNGGLVNAVNAVSIWAHIHFQALNGGQIILSACSTQFGDYSMQAKGFRNLIVATEVENLSIQTAAYDAILAVEQDLIDSLWGALVFEGYTVDWPDSFQVMTRRDAATFLQCIRWTLKTANQQPMLDFAKGLFNVIGNLVLTTDSLASFIYSFNYLRASIKALPGVNAQADTIVDNLVDALLTTIQNPVIRKEPSRITAIGHTWTAVMAGVALTKIPPARNSASITDSILEEEEGVVIASGQDDQGNALFVGGLAINADTGELGGPPFDQAVRRVATRAAISRSF